MTFAGSSVGLCMPPGKFFIEQGHGVVPHARNAARTHATRAALPAREAIVISNVALLLNRRCQAVPSRKQPP